MKKIVISILIVGVIVIGAGCAFFGGRLLNGDNNKNSTKSVNLQNTSTTATSTVNADSNKAVAKTSTTPTVTKTNTSNQVESQNNNSGILNEGTGNFPYINAGINAGGYIAVNQLGDNKSFILTDIHQSGKALVGTCYENNLQEKTTFYIVNLGNNQYKFYNFYNGSMIKSATTQYEKKYNGYFGEIVQNNSGEAQKASFIITTPQNPAPFGNSPYYIGEIGNTRVTLAQNMGDYILEEYYNGDSNMFYLQDLNGTVPEPLREYKQKYQWTLTETYKDEITGYYFINYSENGENFKGIYVKANKNTFGKPVEISFNGVNTL